MFNKFGSMQTVSEHVSNILSRGEDFKNDSESKLEELKEQVRKAMEFVGACDDLMSEIRNFEELKVELERDYDVDLD